MSASADWSLPLLLRSAVSACCQPVTRGVPLPRGLLTDPGAVRLTDECGREVALQTEALARWPGGSVRWLLLDFLPDRLSAGEVRWALRPRTGPAVTGQPTFEVREAANEVVVTTGATAFSVCRAAFELLIGEAALVSPVGRPHKEAGAGIGFRRRSPGAADVTREVSVEGTGRVRTTVRLRGDLPRSRCVYAARLSFFAGTGVVRVRLAVRNPRRGAHAGGLWDLGDRGSVLLGGVELGVLGPENPRVRWTAGPGQPVREVRGARLDVRQESSGGDGGRGLRANPVVSLVGERAALTVAVPEFWQRFPASIEVDGRRILLGLPPAGDRPFELQGGEQMTATVWLHFGPPPGADELPLAWVHQPVTITLPPEWYAACGVLPGLPSGEEESRLDTLLHEVVDGPNSFFARREVIDEYGWRNYGEVYADHENAHYDGPRPIVSHYNNQYDVIHGLLLHYFRTGDSRWWELADPLARHVIDIDIYHTRRDRAAYCGGLFWHTDHHKDAATCTHRGYSRANAPPGKPYGGGPSCEHNYTTGLLHYYYLTGEPPAGEAVLELAGWVLRMDDGSRNVLGLVDDGPTGLASATREPGYHGPGRGAGNSVNALLDAWLLTGGRHYLDYAEALIRRCIHPADDVAGRDLLNVEDRWSYTVFLSALSRFLDLKAEAGELDATYAYGRASLLRYAEWMEQNERPYFDQVEKLEFPTETWAAQEMRKANVLRLAARHADEPLHSRLRRRGEEFAERAWSDLLRFESRTTARPLAIMMREGLADVCLRCHAPPPAPRPHGEHPFGPPEEFLPQRQRVKARLKAPGGLLHMGLRLLSPHRWRRYLTRYQR